MYVDGISKYSMSFVVLLMYYVHFMPNGITKEILLLVRNKKCFSVILFVLVQTLGK